MEVINKFIEDANIIELLTNGLINLIIALVIFVVGKWIARAVQNTLEKILRKREVDEVLVDFLG
jgi:small conductance mechanosensitive channel